MFSVCKNINFPCFLFLGFKGEGSSEGSSSGSNLCDGGSRGKGSSEGSSSGRSNLCDGGSLSEGYKGEDQCLYQLAHNLKNNKNKEIFIYLYFLL